MNSFIYSLIQFIHLFIQEAAEEEGHRGGRGTVSDRQILRSAKLYQSKFH